MIIDAVGNNDPCGNCGARHGGNHRLCPVHGAVSGSCCAPLCNPSEWIRLADRHPRHTNLLINHRLIKKEQADLNGYTMEPPYWFQDDGTGNYNAWCVQRYVK